MKHHFSLLLLLLLAATPARGDQVRNVQVGETVPPFTLRTLAGEELSSDQLRGRAVALVYVSAGQRSSETATQQAAVVGRELRGDGLATVFLTADATRVGYFRQLRDQLKIHDFPLGIDVGRRVYGDLGLIVLPTTIVIDREGRLAHVISSCRSDYEPMLRAYARHALGRIDDAQLQELLTTRSVERNTAEDRIARHRAAARLLREKNLWSEAQAELNAALAIDGENTDAMLDLASLQIEQGNFDEAGRLVALVRGREPDHRRARLMTGILLFHDDCLDEADLALTEVLLLNPDPIWTHYYLGLVKERQGDETAALMHLKEALSRALADRPL